MAQLALALLAAQDRSLDHRLTVIETALQEVVGKPLALSSPPMGESLSGRGKRPLNQAEERVRSRRPPLIEYSAQGTYVIVSMQEGELDVEPDEEE